MNLGTMLYEQLQKPEHGSNTVTVQEDSRFALVTVVDSDRYSITMRNLTVGGMFGHASAVQAFLDTAANALIHELQYLEEPLTVVECDAGEGHAVLRSVQPQREGAALSYWEITLDAGATPTMQIARYCWTPGIVEREPVAYPATFRLLARLTNSMETALVSAL